MYLHLIIDTYITLLDFNTNFHILNYIELIQVIQSNIENIILNLK